jgi:geranylgeranyl pyrophosphate synthase
MDNDDLRRGKPTCHKKFSEWMAVLAGDALLNKAFEVMLSSIKTEKEIKAASFISSCAGKDGMIGGQVLDISYENKNSYLGRFLCGIMVICAGCVFQFSSCYARGRSCANNLR